MMFGDGLCLAMRLRFTARVTDYRIRVGEGTEPASGDR